MMHSRVFRIVVLLIVLAATGIFIWTIFRSFFFVPDTQISTPPIASSTVTIVSKPVRLQIPSLHIDAFVQEVGITARGAMGVPNNFRDVGWYKYGPAPGQIGSAVIDGHVDNGLALSGVFKHLSDITKGDDVYILAEDGLKLHFVVVNIQSYPYQNAPSDLIFTQNDVARLNLITCSGKWIASRHTYDKRIVVYTQLSD